MRKLILVITIMLSLAGCQRSIHNISELNNWLNDPDNGCAISKNIAGISLSVKYLPPMYMVMKEMNRAGQAATSVLKDSLLDKQNHLITFLFSLNPAKNDKNNVQPGQEQVSVMYSNVPDYAAYVDRMMTMNFSMERYVDLYIDGVKYKPVLTTVENLYELSDGRNFVVMFMPDNKTYNLPDVKELTFVYADPFFNMGNVQMNFSGKDLGAAQKLNYVLTN